MMTYGNNKKIPKSEQTRTRIADTYFDLMTTKKWDKITVKELCVNAEITRGTFYQYFNDIYDMMEQIQTILLDDLTSRYRRAKNNSSAPYPIELFNEKFDYAPPEELKCWFTFCKKHEKAMAALLDPQKGSSYFVKKVKVILNEQIHLMMDRDGMPRDEMRTHFIKIFIEMHFLATRSWLDSDTEDYLPLKDVLHLLNTMRIGGNYLTYRRYTSPDYEEKMNITEEEGY